MTAIHRAIAYEPGVVPEPLAEPAGLIQFLRLLRDNQLSVFTRGSFVDEFGEARLLFHNFVLVNEPDFIEHILVTNHQNYVKGQLTRQILQPALGNSLLISEGLARVTFGAASAASWPPPFITSTSRRQPM